MKLTILRGIPASGKSTFAKEFIKSTTNTIRVNMDSLRMMLSFETFNPKYEKIVKKSEMKIIQMALEKGFDVLVDDTNITTKRLRSIINQTREYKPTVDVITLDVDVSIALYRNSRRNELKIVPELDMNRMYINFDKSIVFVQQLLKEEGILHTIHTDRQLFEDLK